MRIFFRTKKLQKICENYKQASKKWGPEAARRLVRRLEQIKASSNLKIFMLVHRRCHHLTGNRKGQYAADLKHPGRLIFYPCDEEAGIIDESAIDPESISAVLIYEVLDYHD
jgi:proteic killer suppression protein